MDTSKIIDAAVEASLKAQRDVRDDKQNQDVYGTYTLDPRVFAKRPHYIAGPIAFSSPFLQSPAVTFGQYAEQATQDVPVNILEATGYTPLIIHPYIYQFIHTAGSVDSFYLGLYALTPVPTSLLKYTIAFHARGKGSPYPMQRIDEAWTSAYDKNHPEHLVNETGVTDDQSSTDT